MVSPHPGNFRILADGRLGVLDFGSAFAMDGGLPVIPARHEPPLLATMADGWPVGPVVAFVQYFGQAQRRHRFLLGTGLRSAQA